MMGQAADTPTTASRRIALLVLIVVSVFNYLDRTVISILQVPIKRDLSLSDAQLGALTGLTFALFYSTLGVPIARLADRYSRRIVIAGSLLLWSAMTAVSGFAGSFAMLVFFRIGVALGEAGSIPASHSMIADYYPPERRATALGIWGLALPIGVMLGYLSGGWLAQAIDWRAALWIIGGIGVVLAPIVLMMLREPVRGRYDAGPAPDAMPWRDGLALMARRPSLLLLFAGGALNNVVLSVALNWNAPFYTRLHGMALGDVATALSLMTGLGGAIGIFLGGWLTDRIGADKPHLRPVLTGIALIAVTPAALVQLLSPSTTVSLIACAMTVMLLFFYYAPIIAMTQTLVPASMRAFTSSILLLSVNLIGLGLGPWLTGVLSDVIGMGDQSLRYAMAAMSFVGIFAGSCFLLAARYYKKDLAK
ncbi:MULTISPECIES: spinster family MFS transporter [Sphingomonas]|jgi:predicted MFS family arabinose efflux permease|uniref:spinster family MFS transporter n=2 Tax=Sphingomonadaceae TaxID=41297 RepID=UPI0020178DAC|nr:MFS transporter [Sphingomonas sp. CFBP 8765]